MSGPIWLQRPNASVPWGFRLKGGRDFQEPLTVQRVTVGSVASTGLSIGDVIMSIGETDTASLTNSQAQELIKSGGNLLQLYVRKASGDAPSGQHQQQQPVGRPAVQGALHELFDDIFKESDAMFSSLEADQQKQQARAAHAGSYDTTPNYASAGRQRPHPVEVVRGGPCNGYGPSQYQSPGSHQNDCTSPSSEGIGFPTRLARQLSDLSTNSYPSPPPSNPTTPQQQTGPPDFGSCYGHRPTPIRRTPVQSPDQGLMPDAVLNMAARGGSDKKPFSYVPNTDMLQEQRNRVRRKPASAAVLPHYQSMLGTFDDSPLPNNSPLPMTSPVQATPEPAGEGETVVSHVQYNTPIGLYSNDNVMEAFEGQTGGLVTGVDGVPGKPKADITQSAVYQMIHGGDNQSRGRQRIPPPVRSKPTVSRDPTGNDEMRFSGLPSERAVPSKSFSMLQNMTSPSEVDTTSIMRPIGADDVDEVSGYDETSIRYRGCNIPSKSFRMLQNMTGSTGEVPAGVRQRPRKTPERILEEQNESQGNTDDIVDISYVGSNIPSRSFRFLQKSVGDDVESPSDEQMSTLVTPIPITITSADGLPGAELTTQQQAAVASDRRRRRRLRTHGLQDGHLSANTIPTANVEPSTPEIQPSHDQHLAPSSQTEINTPVVTSERGRIRTRQPQQQQTTQPTVHSNGPASTTPVHIASVKTPRDAPVVRPVYQTSQENGRSPQIKTIRSAEAIRAPKSCREAPSIPTFDEDAYLSGNITIVSGSVNNPRQYKDRFKRIDQPYNDDAVSEKENTKSKEPFNETAFLCGEVSLFGDETLPRPKKVKGPYREKAAWERDQDSTIENYDETKFVRRPSMDILSERAPWQRDENERNNYDENTFLGRRSISREMSSEPVPWQKDEDDQRSKYFDAFAERQISRDSTQDSTSDPAPWVRDEEEEQRRIETYDENKFLGRTAQKEKKVELAPWQRNESEDDMMKRYFNANNVKSKSKKIQRERAPWERDHTSDDTGRDYDENTFLGRSTSLSENGHSDDGSEDLPIRTFHVLRQSQSREMTPDEAYDSASDDGSEMGIKKLVYVGKNIPSKAFKRLQTVMDRRASIDLLNDARLDVDVAMTKIDIGTHEPDKYLDLLRKSVEEQTGIEVAVENDETTDF